MINSLTNVRFYNFGVFCLDVIDRELLKNGEHIALTQKSFEILRLLIENRSRMMKKDEILNTVWSESFVEEANLAQHIYMIRKVLKDNGEEGQNYIETIPKYGYRFACEVTESSTQDQLLHRTFLANPPKENGSNGNGHKKTDNEFISKTETEDIKAKPPSPKPKRLVLIPNMVLASVFAIIIFGFIYLAYFSLPPKQTDISNIESISILPFTQIGGDKDEKLRLGLADTLISRLSNQNQISISPTTTIKKINANEPFDSIKVGEELDVDAVLTGTIQKENEYVRINVQLISVRTKVPIWSDKFDVEFSDIFSLQDKISEKLATKLSIKLNNSEQFVIKENYSTNAEAEAEFARGVKIWKTRTSDNLPKAIEHFEKAIHLDEKFASAYAHLADCYSLVGVYRLKSIMPSEEAIEKAETFANKALELDSDLSQAYNALGMVSVYHNNQTKAQKFYKKAIRLNPDNATAHQRLAWILTTEESLEKAITEMRLAQKANPTSHTINMSLASLLRLNRQTDEALDYAKIAIKNAPSKNYAKMILAEIYEQKGQLDKSIKELKNVPKDAPEEKTAKLLLSRVYAKKGNKQEARQMLKDADSIKGKSPLPSYEVATVYAHLGEKKAAVKKLQKAKDDSLMYFLHLKYDYNIDPLRDTPEYSKILSESKDKLPKTEDKNS